MSDTDINVTVNVTEDIYPDVDSTAVSAAVIDDGDSIVVPAEVDFGDTLDAELEDENLIDVPVDESVGIQGDHRVLLHRDAANQHPMSAITGLGDALDAINTELSSRIGQVEAESAELEVDMASALLRIGDLQDQVDGNITTWFYAAEPAMNLPPVAYDPSNPHDTGWDTPEKKNAHKGDLYYNTLTGYAYRFAYADGDYGWMRITDTDVVKALADAARAQDTADSKRRVFYSTPYPPYDKGDLWVQGSSGDILVCTTSKPADGSYSESDWSSASKYTDDYVANIALASANSKNTVYHQPSQPTGGTYKKGDTWFDSDDDYTMYTYDGALWIKEQFGNEAIADASITNAKIANATIEYGKIKSVDAGKITVGTLDAARIGADSIGADKIKVNEIEIGSLAGEIGGRNLVTHSLNLSDFLEEQRANCPITVYPESASITHVVNSSATLGVYYDILSPEVGAEYTLSFDGTAVSGGRYSVGGAGTSSGWAGIVNYTTIKTGRNAVTFTVPSGATSLRIYFSVNVYNSVLWVSHVQLEKGSVATDWKPSPYDIEPKQRIKADKIVSESSANVSYSLSGDSITMSRIGSTGIWGMYYDFPCEPNSFYTVSAKVTARTGSSWGILFGTRDVVADGVSIWAGLGRVDNSAVGVGGYYIARNEIITYAAQTHIRVYFCSNTVGDSWTIQDITFQKGGDLATSSSYITHIDNSGIIVHPSGSTSNRVGIDGSGVYVYKGDSLRATYGDTVTLQSSNGTYPRMTVSSTEAYFQTASNSWATMSGDGFTIRSSGSDVASFGATVTVGKSNSNRVVVGSSNVSIYDSNNKERTQINTSGLLIKNASGNTKATIYDTITLYAGAGTFPLVEVGSSAVKIGQSGDNYALVNSSGLQVWQDAVEVASFGSTVRVGSSSSTNINLTSSSINLKVGTFTAGYFAVNNSAAYLYLRDSTDYASNLYPRRLSFIGSDWTVARNKGELTSTHLYFSDGDGFISLLEDNRLFLYSKAGYVKTSGRLEVTANGNTVTIGSWNSSWCHIYNSESIPFIFNNTVTTTSGNLGTTSYPWEDLYMSGHVGKTTAPTAYSQTYAAVWHKADSSTLHTLCRPSSSSIRYKEDVKAINEDSLDPRNLYDIPVVQFKFKEGYFAEDDPYNKSRHNVVGLIAEDVDEHYPVACIKIDGEAENWNERYIIPPMLALIQEQHKEIDNLKSEVEELKGVIKCISF